MANSIPDYFQFRGTNFTTYKLTVGFDSAHGYYTGVANRVNGGFPTVSDSGEIIIELDWSSLSGEVFDEVASTYGVGYATAKILMWTNLVPELNGHSVVELPIHLIGHSRGGSLMAEISKQLGTNGIWIDQLTTLDPHPVNNDGNTDPIFYDDAPVTTYANVLFSDNYWQDLGYYPNGEAVFGAYNRELFNLTGGYDSDHSNVHLWYHGTIDLTTPTSDTGAWITSSERSNWWVPYEDYQSYDGLVAGFFYSAIGHGNRLSTAQPLGVGYPAIRDGFNQQWDMGAGTSVNRTALPSNAGTWPNPIKFNVTGTNVVTAGDSIFTKLFYQYGGPAANVSCQIYLDPDLNPLNSNSIVVSQFQAPNSGANSVYFYSDLALNTTNVSPGYYFIYAAMTDGQHTRYLYTPGFIQIKSANTSDVTSPTILITAPTANHQATNSVVTVAGIANDNIAVAGVWYQVNGGDWLLASGTTAWAANVALEPGTNTINAYATDGSGNNSTTNTITVFFAQSIPISIQINGPGTVTPNYSNQVLQVGKMYKISAKPLKGCKFLGWTGGIITNAPKLTFVMTTNLALTANFVDVAAPASVVIYPKVKQLITNSLFTATGRAKDNIGIQSVFYDFNGSGWATANGTMNWSVPNLTLVPGTNTIRAYAVDAKGNASRTNIVTFKH